MALYSYTHVQYIYWLCVCNDTRSYSSCAGFLEDCIGQMSPLSLLQVVLILDFLYGTFQAECSSSKEKSMQMALPVQCDETQSP